MVMDALRGYVQLANGLTEVTRQRAQQAAKALLQQTGADALTTKVSDLADEIVATSKSNRQLLQAIVANEVEGAVSRLGFVRSEEVGVLARRVDRLERELAETKAAAEAAGSVAATAAGTAAAAAEKATPVAPAAAPAAKKAPAKKVAAQPVPTDPAVKKAAKKAAKKAPAKKV
ncbi:polyhydroxyalkanoate synthesis protein PhaF [Kribbella flavida DSM 17836]|uniref:Polyhydroxyalkanoate synthesis protein PhaF n=1 Tax=Kribbella flavida (strain DSM 17836 / JCM 10339 / NBRC 14399) TaxID=479435 RepID=D2PM67_KRIFD|nr:phasin family protein [Kribbella flavida]ADB34435.1 polyhydroxyalkanoate synthesis protein PhaF [Kribbella flavida DSM 17836]